MDAIIVDIIMFLCTAFALCYSSFHLAAAKKDPFYVFLYLAFVAFFVGKLYNLIYELSGWDSYLFTLGDLGSVSGFLFASYAILGLREEKALGGTRKGRLFSLVLPAVIVLMWLALFLQHLRFEKMILADMYLVVNSLCSYLCVGAIIETRSKGHPYRQYAPLWGVIAVMNVLTMTGELFWVIDSYAFADLLAVLVLVVVAICYVLMPILLERGRRTCRV